MPYSILLIDDNVELLDLVAQSLRILGGYTTTTATDGLIGLELASTTAPDCIVVDVMMPELNGYQLVRSLRGDPATASIPLVILTAVPQDQGNFTGMAAGADYYITKPVTISDLVAAIQHAIATSNVDRAARLRQLASDEGDPAT
jgi:two-component system, OmpR family, alkaline phosphatase synthesis response regulator PhoP